MKILTYVIKSKTGDVTFYWDGKDYHVEPRIFGTECILCALIDGVTMTVAGNVVLVPLKWIKQLYQNSDDAKDLETFERMMKETRLGAKQVRGQKPENN